MGKVAFVAGESKLPIVSGHATDIADGIVVGVG